MHFFLQWQCAVHIISRFLQLQRPVQCIAYPHVFERFSGTKCSFLVGYIIASVSSQPFPQASVSIVSRLSILNSFLTTWLHLLSVNWVGSVPVFFHMNISYLNQEITYYKMQDIKCKAIICETWFFTCNENIRDC